MTARGADCWPLQVHRMGRAISCAHRLQDRFENAHVAGAAAEISGEAFFNLLKRRIGVLLEEGHRGEDHAGGADAALGSPMVEECLLDGI